MHIATLAPGPAGSSFANRNNALGIHAPSPSRSGKATFREVAALNRGAWLDPRLLAIQAEEAAARLADLVNLGLPFERTADGGLLAHSSCFSPSSRRAYVFKGLGAAWRCFRERLDVLDCVFLTGVSVAGVRGGCAPGALLLAGDGTRLQVDAGSVVVALGGPCSAFPAHPVRPRQSGIRPWPAGRSRGAPGQLRFCAVHVGQRCGQAFLAARRLERGRPGLASVRREHCPYGYGLPDAAIDRSQVLEKR